MHSKQNQFNTNLYTDICLIFWYVIQIQPNINET